MPPSKAEKAKKQKVVDDKTFGLKNKNKSKKVQQYVQQMQQAANQANNKKKQEGPSKKELELQRKQELNEIFKPVQLSQKVPFGVDPKTILCQFHKMGTCTKGKNCKFSHDLNVERKSAKIDLYTDARAQSGSGQSKSKEDLDKENDTMDKWDQAKLEEVVSRKAGKNAQPTTDIVCKYFIQAVEDRKYGWFWQCPNGIDCKYKHALPPGFQLKESGRRGNGEDEVVQTLEEWIEEERKRMPTKLTPVTLDSFNKWKQDRLTKQKKEQDELRKSREAAIKAGKMIGASGRELFTFNADLYQRDDDEDNDGEVVSYDYANRDDDNTDADQDEDEPEVDESAFQDLDLSDDEQDASEKDGQ
ncbi:hypothetical protein MIR68_009287 [Amoeboaphelidium protococcarum]|nr:hypothetical protein MIR68_009287 [Amoeboaphelidium protococcarum]